MSPGDIESKGLSASMVRQPGSRPLFATAALEPGRRLPQRSLADWVSFGVKRAGERAHGLYCRRVRPIGEAVERPVPHEHSGSADASFLVGCNAGLLIHHEGQLTRLLNGPVYGISRRQGSWYALQRLGRSARIVRFALDLSHATPSATGLTVVVDGLSAGVHQIDFVFDRLIVTDTYYNAIRIYRPDGRLSDIAYPLGALRRNDIFSGNYAHFNSVYWDGRDVLLVAHNNSLKTGQRSRIYALDFERGDRVHCIVDDAGHGAHNVMRIDGGLLWCDSLNGRLVRDGETVASIDGFMTRGLAADARYVIAGGSAYSFGKDRLASSGCIVIWDRAFERLDTVSIAGSGGISEIRMLDDDIGFSAANAPEKLDAVWRNAD